MASVQSKLTRVVIQRGRGGQSRTLLREFLPTPTTAIKVGRIRSWADDLKRIKTTRTNMRMIEK